MASDKKTKVEQAKDKQTKAKIGAAVLTVLGVIVWVALGGKGKPPIA